MQHDIEALALLVRRDAQAVGQQADDLEDDEGDDGAVGDRDRHAIKLRADLPDIAVDPAHRRFGPGHDLRRERAGQNGAQRAADAMDAERIERIVVTQRVLERGAGEEADDAGNEAYPQAARGIAETPGRRHGYETCNRTS